VETDLVFWKKRYVSTYIQIKLKRIQIKIAYRRIQRTHTNNYMLNTRNKNLSVNGYVPFKYVLNKTEGVNGRDRTGTVYARLPPPPPLKKKHVWPFKPTHSQVDKETETSESSIRH
jgi:hypothetical protein